MYVHVAHKLLSTAYFTSFEYILTDIFKSLDLTDNFKCGLILLWKVNS